MKFFNRFLYTRVGYYSIFLLLCNFDKTNLNKFNIGTYRIAVINYLCDFIMK